MEPRIQYAQTSDAVSIAYAVFGNGPAIVFVSGAFGGLHLLSSGVLPGASQNTDALVALGRCVIHYDGRGTGSSDRSNTDFSLDARIRDLEAVIGRVGAERLALYGVLQGGPTAIAYADRHRERVTSLVLTLTFARAADWYNVVPSIRASRATDSMIEEEWEFYTLSLANAATGFRDSDLANKLAGVMRAGMSPGALPLFIDANARIDVTNLLPLVSVPTLVLYQKWNHLSNIDLLRPLASGIPNARLVRPESEEELALVVDAFLREGEEQAVVPPDLPSGMTAILFIDIADSTALTERLGDDAFRGKARELGTALRALVRECGGTPVEGPTLGDGVLAVFTSARAAIDAALRSLAAGESVGLSLHLGIHAGDVTHEKDPDGRDNVYGGAVNIAARISGLSAAGEVLVSGTVRDLARTSAGVTFDDRGEQALKGVSESQRLFVVRPREA